MKPLHTPLQCAAILAMAFAMLAGGCSKQSNEATRNGAPPSSEAGSANPQTTIWTCSMHPEVQKDGPGKCPTCGMDLIQKQS